MGCVSGSKFRVLTRGILVVGVDKPRGFCLGAGGVLLVGVDENSSGVNPEVSF